MKIKVGFIEDEWPAYTINEPGVCADFWIKMKKRLYRRILREQKRYDKVQEEIKKIRGDI